MSKPPSKPDTAKAPAKSAGAALPDAALLEREDSDGADAALAPVAKTGLRRFLPSGVLGWTVTALVALIVVLGIYPALLLRTIEPSVVTSITASVVSPGGGQ